MGRAGNESRHRLPVKIAVAAAIAITILLHFKAQAITPTTASAAIVMAFFTASLSKLATAAWLGGRALIRRAWAPIIIPVAATALGMLLVAWR